MDLSDGVTLEDCPTCQRVAAVGWFDGQVLAFDCPAGCRLTAQQREAFAARRGRAPALWLTRV
jgi:hypothetical protein